MPVPGTEIDVTSADIIEKMVKEFRGKGIEVYMAEVHVPVREYASETGLLEVIGEDHLFPTIDLAVKYIEHSKKEKRNDHR